MCDEKRYIFCKRITVSLRKVMFFCYTNTAYSCAGTDTVITVELLTTLRMNSGAEEFLTPVTASNAVQ